MVRGEGRIIEVWLHRTFSWNVFLINYHPLGIILKPEILMWKKNQQEKYKTNKSDDWRFLILIVLDATDILISSVLTLKLFRLYLGIVMSRSKSTDSVVEQIFLTCDQLVVFAFNLTVSSLYFDLFIFRKTETRGRDAIKTTFSLRVCACVYITNSLVAFLYIIISTYIWVFSHWHINFFI